MPEPIPANTEPETQIQPRNVANVTENAVDSVIES